MRGREGGREVIDDGGRKEEGSEGKEGRREGVNGLGERGE